jgi:hypothetical protein
MTTLDKFVEILKEHVEIEKLESVSKYPEIEKKHDSILFRFKFKTYENQNKYLFQILDVKTEKKNLLFFFSEWPQNSFKRSK